MTRAYRLDLFLAGSFDIIHMNKTVAVATLDKTLQINVGIVIAGCHGMMPIQMACRCNRGRQTRMKIDLVVALSTVTEKVGWQKKEYLITSRRRHLISRNTGLR